MASDHGEPARLLVPHLHFWKSAKWLNGLRFTERNEVVFRELRGDPFAEERCDAD